MAELAEATSVSLVTPYNYFGSKAGPKRRRPPYKGSLRSRLNRTGGEDQRSRSRTFAALCDSAAGVAAEVGHLDLQGLVGVAIELEVALLPLRPAIGVAAHAHALLAKPAGKENYYGFMRSVAYARR